MPEGLNPVGPRTLVFMDERYECENYKECWFKYCELVSEHCDEQFDVVFSYEGPKVALYKRAEELWRSGNFV